MINFREGEGEGEGDYELTFSKEREREREIIPDQFLLFLYTRSLEVPHNLSTEYRNTIVNQTEKKNLPLHTSKDGNVTHLAYK